MRLLASEGLSFFVRSLSYFGQILELFLEIDNFHSISMKIEQKQHEFTLFLPINGKFVNKNDFKSKTPKKKQQFCYTISQVFLLKFVTTSNRLSFLPRMGLKFFCGWP